jgi:transcriptional regulator with XRE-family HTH domain
MATDPDGCTRRGSNLLKDTIFADDSSLAHVGGQVVKDQPCHSCDDKGIILQLEYVVNSSWSIFVELFPGCEMKDASNRFGKRLKELREQAGLTQPQLGEKASLSKAGIAHLEQGEREPSWSTVQAICAALNVSCEAFNQESAERPDVGRGRPSKQPTDQKEEPSVKRPRGRPKKGS